MLVLPFTIEAPGIQINGRAGLSGASTGRWTDLARRHVFAYGIVFALLAGACGGAATSGGSGSTVSVRAIPGVGNVYTNAQGMSLYTPLQEASGTVLCTGSCTSVWIPLRAPANGSPTKASGVRGALGVITRPDGTKQVTLGGAPLYLFHQDMAPGNLNGNGIADSFGGQNFTWHVASGGAVANTPTAPGPHY